MAQSPGPDLISWTPQPNELTLMPRNQLNFDRFYQKKRFVRRPYGKAKDISPLSSQRKIEKLTPNQSYSNERKESYLPLLANSSFDRGYSNRTPAEFSEEKLVLHPVSKRYHFARSQTPTREYIKMRAKDYLGKVNQKRTYSNANPEISDLIEYLDGPFLENVKERKQNFNFAESIIQSAKQSSSPRGDILDVEKSQLFITKEPIPVRFDHETSYQIPMLNVKPLHTNETTGENGGQPQPFSRVGREIAGEKKTNREGLKFVNVGNSHRSNSTEPHRKEIRPHIPLKPVAKQQFFAKMMPLKSMAPQFKAPIRQDKALEKFDLFGLYENGRLDTSAENYWGSFNLAKLDSQEAAIYKNHTPTSNLGLNQTQGDVLQEIQRHSPVGGKPLLNDIIKDIIEREQKISSEIKRTFQPFPYHSSQIKRKRTFLVPPNQLW